MKNYEALEDLRAKATFHIEKAFDRGYEQGYNDCKVELLEDEAKCHYQEGYNDGYRKGVERGKEVRVAEADCAYQCGMKRAWEAARKILHMEQRDINKMMGGSDFGDINIIDELTPQEVISELEAWEKEQTEKSCKTCKSNPPEKKWPCVDCDVSIHDRYEPKKDTPETNVGSIEVGDEVTYNIGNVMVVTYIAVESKCADVLKSDGTTDQMPLEILEKTGKHYDIQALLDAMKSEKPEEGGE